MKDIYGWEKGRYNQLLLAASGSNPWKEVVPEFRAELTAG